MPPTENLLDEISIEQIKEQKIESVCYQLSTRKKWGFQSSFNSTSFFINRNFLLTSAHNVVKTFRKVNKLVISPSRIGNNYHYGSVTIHVDYSKHLRIYPDYRMRNRATRHLYDIALVYVPDDILDTNPSFETLNSLPILEDISSLSVGETVYCAGYPASGVHKGRYKMTLDSSTVIDINDHYFEHKLDTRTGNSGSPIMVKRDGRYYVIGVNSIRHKGTLLNNEKKLWMEEGMQQLRHG